MPIPKFLFLEVDGVLWSERSKESLDGVPRAGSFLNSLDYIDPLALTLLRKLCKDTEANIVLSSAWRILCHYNALARLWKLPIIGATPHGISPASQQPTQFMDHRKPTMSIGQEIQSWLETNVKEPCRFAIVHADRTGLLPTQLERLVRIDEANGLLWEDYLRLGTLLR